MDSSLKVVPAFNVGQLLFRNVLSEPPSKAVADIRGEVKADNPLIN